MSEMVPPEFQEKPITRKEISDSQRLQWVAWGVSVVLIVVSGFLGVKFGPLPPTPGDPLGPAGAGFYSNFSGIQVAIPTTAGTATPGVLIESSALGNAFEVSVAGTPAIIIDADGDTTIAGTCSGCSVSTTAGIGIAQPTSAATATPALRVNSLAAGSKLVEVQDAATPVFSILNGGAVSRTGDDTMTGDLGITGDVSVVGAGRIAAATAVATATPALLVNNAGVSQVASFQDGGSEVLGIINGGQVSVSGFVAVAAPTAQPTGSPALVVDSDGVSVLLEVRDAATPVAVFPNGGGLDLSVGTFTMANDEVISNATNGVVTVDGEWGYLGYLIDKTADYTATVAESGAWYTNDGAGGAITFTLPSAAEGLVFGFIEQDDQDIFLVPASGEQILSETDAADDHLGQATQYGVIRLLSDGSGWLPIQVIGTWDDEDG